MAPLSPLSIERASQHAPSAKILPLCAVVKDFSWGIRGLDSRVARFALESGIIDEVDPDKPYAELWLGTHPSEPTTLRDGTKLEQLLGRQLPFLLKVLSAGKASGMDMPIRNHADNNRKHQLVVALTPFEAMCGFRRLEEIAALIKKHPEFAACISDEAKLKAFVCSLEETEKENVLSVLFESFMNCPKETLSKQLNKLLNRLQKEQSCHLHPHKDPPWERKCALVILRLAQQFPGDRSVMCPFFLNYVLIAPGESFYMAANEPRAYIAGEIVECVAFSETTSAIAPKVEGAGELEKVSTYSMGGPIVNAGTPTDGDDRKMRYMPPTGDFEVMLITCNPGESIMLPQLPVPSLFIVIEGSGSTKNEFGHRLVMRPGRSYLMPANCPPFSCTVDARKRGPLRLVLAHESQHTETPNMGSYAEIQSNLSGGLALSSKVQTEMPDIGACAKVQSNMNGGHMLPLKEKSSLQPGTPPPVESRPTLNEDSGLSEYGKNLTNSMTPAKSRSLSQSWMPLKVKKYSKLPVEAARSNQPRVPLETDPSCPTVGAKVCPAAGYGTCQQLTGFWSFTCDC